MNVKLRFQPDQSANLVGSKGFAAARGLEEAFVAELLKVGMSSVQKTDSQYESFLNNAFAEEIAKKGNLGIAQSIYENMQRNMVADRA